MAHAKYHGTCTRCGGRIAIGDDVRFYNRPKPKSIYHAACPVPDATATEEVETFTEFKDERETPETAATTKPERKPAAPGSVDALIDARIDARLAGFEPESAVSEETVRRIVAEVASSTTILEVKRLDGTTAKVDGAHYLFPRLVSLLGAGLHVYLWGPAGSGKTTAALMAAEALGRKGEIDTLDPSTPKSSILGYRTPTGEPVQTAFTRCYGEGHAYVADECDNAPAHVQTLFNSALANGHAPAAWGLIPRAENFTFVGTGNTPGRPTPAFPDRRPMSAAFADRLYFMHWPLDPTIECRAAGLPLPKPPKRKVETCTPADWVTWVQTIREWASKSAPALMVTPRASLTGLQALALGETPEEAAHGLVFRGADAALVSKALSAVPLP